MPKTLGRLARENGYGIPGTGTTLSYVEDGKLVVLSEYWFREMLLRLGLPLTSAPGTVISDEDATRYRGELYAQGMPHHADPESIEEQLDDIADVALTEMRPSVRRVLQPYLSPLVAEQATDAVLGDVADWLHRLIRQGYQLHRRTPGDTE